MNQLFKLFTLIFMTILVVGCSGKPVPQDSSGENNPSDFLSEKQENWLQTNHFGKYDNDLQDWTAIEAAAMEEGSVIVYSNSSRMNSVIDAWAKMYPDIALIVNDSDDITVMVEAEQKAENVYGDVWFSNGDAYVVGNLLPHRYLLNFVPDTLDDKISAEFTETLLIPQFAATVLAYNSELNDNCPVSNIWELTEPEWKDKIIIEDPLTDTSTLNILLTYINHAEEMKAAYVDLYGYEPELDADTPDAGWLWLKRFAQNAPIPEQSGKEVYSAFASPGMNDSYLAFTPYSSYSDVLDGTLVFEPCWDVQPVLGVQSQSYLAIINLAPHPNAAKLFVRFITSEEGRMPWESFGSYLTDSTYQIPEGQMDMKEMLAVTWFVDDQFAYENMIFARDFYFLNLTNP